MKQRGRQSASATQTATERWENRPSAPADLSGEGAELWRGIVASKSPDYFDAGTIPMLREYCILDGDVAMLNEQLRALDPEWLKDDAGVQRYDKLTAIRDKMQNRMIRIATSLRLTNQSRFQPVTASTRQKPQSAQKPPWQS